MNEQTYKLIKATIEYSKSIINNTNIDDDTKNNTNIEPSKSIINNTNINTKNNGNIGNRNLFELKLHSARLTIDKNNYNSVKNSLYIAILYHQKKEINYENVNRLKMNIIMKIKKIKREKSYEPEVIKTLKAYIKLIQSDLCMADSFQCSVNLLLLLLLMKKYFLVCSLIYLL